MVAPALLPPAVVRGREVVGIADAIAKLCTALGKDESPEIRDAIDRLKMEALALQVLGRRLELDIPLGGGVVE